MKYGGSENNGRNSQVDVFGNITSRQLDISGEKHTARNTQETILLNSFHLKTAP